MSALHEKNLRKTFLFLAGLFVGIILFATTGSAGAADATVHGVLFFSPTCGHCHKVMEEVLPPLQDQYGDQLVLLPIDVSTQEGSIQFGQAIERFQVTPERRGVPMLVVGDTVLVGSLEIPELLPGLIEAGLASGGVPWPDIPGLQAPPEIEVIQQGRTSVWETFNKDRTANILAVIVLTGMIVSITWIFYVSLSPALSSPGNWPGWVIPVLSVIGLSIAAYLSYIEITRTEAICGPLGNCNAVQSSPYARLFGLVPIGIMGLAGYLAILILWIVKSIGSQKRQKIVIQLIWLLAFAGTLFSLYLTFLEPFVIGATCIWCITSAIIMTLLLWASTGPALNQLKVKTSPRRPYRPISRNKV
jgi:uncharacterized membrane protein